MCGIVGYIGEPKDRTVSYDLTTSLLVKTQVRGDDASGYWACDTQDEDTGAVYFTKAPKRASEFVKGKAWEILKDVPTNLLVAHCRRSTVKGSENRNRNNHPFLSLDYRTALVHNGNIPEFDTLRSDYNVNSDCDSEILLRIIESGAGYDFDYVRSQIGELFLDHDNDKLLKDCNDEEMPQWSPMLMGMIDIFAQINYGAMAVAIGDRWEDGTRALWLMRDKERPLHVVDMRHTLNQIFVVSERRIWREAVDATASVKKFVKGSTPIIEFRPNYIWLLTYSPKGEFKVRKFRTSRTRRHDTTFKKERPSTKKSIEPRKFVRMITDLNHDDHEQDHKNGFTEKNFVSPPLALPAPTAATETKLATVNTISTSTTHTSQNGTIVAGGKKTSPKTTKFWSKDCFEFMFQWIGDSVIMSSISPKCDVTQLKEIAFHNDAGIPDPSIATVKLTSDMYNRWAKGLYQHHNWNDALSKDQENIALWRVLTFAHRAWKDYIATNKVIKLNQMLPISDREPKTDEEAVASVRGSIKLERTKTEDEVSVNDDDDEYPIGVVRRDPLQLSVNSPILPDKQMVNEFDKTIEQIQTTITEIKVRTANLLKDHAITKDDLADALVELKEVSDSLKNQKYIIENLPVTAEKV